MLLLPGRDEDEKFFVSRNDEPRSYYVIAWLLMMLLWEWVADRSKPSK